MAPSHNEQLPKSSCVYFANALADTDYLGKQLAECLPSGTTVGLSGTLGAGKTRLVQAIAAACNVPRELVVSPTFVLCQEYYGSRTIYHLDAYRLQDSEEFQQLGPEEYFQSDGLTLIEWPERVQEAMPSERVEIHIHLEDNDRRRFEIQGIGEHAAAAIDELRQRLAAGS